MSFENHILYEDQPPLVLSPVIELRAQDESGCGYDKPFVALYIDGMEHDKVWAYIDREQGADGGWYSVVKFRRANGNNEQAAVPHAGEGVEPDK